jgi:hypothetical protein
MPDAAPARLPLEQALDEGLVTLFARRQAEAAPASLIRLADRLEAASRRACSLDEARAIT